MIPSLPEYVASSHGRVMRVPHVAKAGCFGSRSVGGVPRTGEDGGEGRLIISFRGKSYKVHRLVCEAFNGPAPFPAAVVMHIDEDYRNNRPENLKWATQRENLNSPGFLSYCRSRTGENSPVIKGRRKA